MALEGILMESVEGSSVVIVSAARCNHRLSSLNSKYSQYMARQQWKAFRKRERLPSSDKDEKCPSHSQGSLGTSFLLFLHCHKISMSHQSTILTSHFIYLFYLFFGSANCFLFNNAP